MANILVVEDSAVQAKHVEMVLRKAGHAVTIAANGVEGYAALRRSLPDIVLTDMHMPEMNGLELVRVVRSEFPQVPIVLTTDQGSEELAVEALRAGAASYIPKRNLARDVVELLEDVLSIAASRKKQSLFLGKLTTVENRFEFDNDTDLVPQVVGHVEALMEQLGVFDASDRMRIGMAVHEACVNAIVHGNLEISSELKNGDWQAYHDAITSRAKQDPFQSRRVKVMIRVARGPFLEVRIKDQGRGFDPSKLPDPTDPANLDKASGRGLLLIRTFFDAVAHRAGGTEISMTKGKATE